MNVSLFQNADRKNKKCIIYLHTYSGNKVEGTFLFDFLPKGTDLALFDFIGSGNSDHGFTTYGLKEKFDVANIIKAISKETEYEEFHLWGRSMGAVVAIQFASHFLGSSVHVYNPISKNQEEYQMKAVYITRNGKTFKKVQRVKVEKKNVDRYEVTPQDQELFRRVKALILDSPFTNLQVMLQGDRFNPRPPQPANEHSAFRDFDDPQNDPQFAPEKNGL